MSNASNETQALSDQLLLLSVANDEYLSASVIDGGFRLNSKGNPLLEAPGLQSVFQALVHENLIHAASQDCSAKPRFVAFQPTTKGLQHLVKSYRSLSRELRYEPGEIAVIPDNQPLDSGWVISEADIVDVNLDCSVGSLSFATYRDALGLDELEQAFRSCPFDGYEPLAELTSMEPPNFALTSVIEAAIENPLQILVFDHLRVRSRYLGAGVGLAALRYLMNETGQSTLSALIPFPLNYTYVSNEPGYVAGLNRLQCLYESMGFRSFHPEQTIMVAIS